MAIRYGRGDVKQTTTGFRGPLMVQSLTSAKSNFLSLGWLAVMGLVEATFPQIHALRITILGERTLAD